MTSQSLQDNILSTYFTLRLGIIVMALALPLILLIGGRPGHLDLLKSMSAYYGGYDGGMRNWFVGILWAIGSFLYLYKGYSTLENVVLNFAGVFAVLVAMVPCNCWPQAVGDENRIHALCAVAFFLCMGVVCLFCAGDTITLLPDQQTKNRFKQLYRVIGASLIASPLVAVVISFVLQRLQSYQFFVEWFGVYVFAFYWFVKSRELSITSAEKLAVHGKLANDKGRGVVREPSS